MQTPKPKTEVQRHFLTACIVTACVWAFWLLDQEPVLPSIVTCFIWLWAVHRDGWLKGASVAWQLGREDGIAVALTAARNVLRTHCRSCEEKLPEAATLAEVTEAMSPEVLAPPKLGDIVPSEALDKDGDITLVFGSKVGGDGRYTGDKVTGKLTELSHMLVGGNQRSGKSVQARALMWQLLKVEERSPGTVMLGLVDMTGVSYSAGSFGGMKQVFTGAVAVKKAEILDFFVQLEAEVGRRETLFQGHPEAEKLSEYNDVVAAEAKLPYIVVFVEELPATLAMLGNAAKAELMSTLFRVPKYGVYFVGLAQRITIETLGPGRDAFATRVWFRHAGKGARDIMELPADLKLSRDVRGRGYFVFAEERGEFHGAWIDKAPLLELVRGLKKGGVV